MNMEEHSPETLQEHQRAILYVKQNGRCWICGNPAHDVAHLFTRARLRTRYDTRDDGNCHLLCRPCHLADHNKVPSCYHEEYKRRFGKSRHDDLKAESQRLVFDRSFMEKELGRLRGEWKDLVQKESPASE